MPLTNAPARKRPKLITLDTIEPQEIKWLWHPYIPAGTVTAIFGRGGMGKSFLTCALSSALSNGQPFPDQNNDKREQKVLLLSAEDDYPTVLVPRLMKQGAKLKNIAVPDFKFVLDKRGAEDVADLMREFAATVVFIDPIVYYAGGKMDMNKSNEVRAMMESLKNSAEASQSSVVIVGHIRKSDEGNDADRMMGSADWVNAARSALLVTKTNDGTSVMRHVKTNYGQHGLSRAFTIDDEGFHWGDAFDEGGVAQSSKTQKKDAAVVFLQILLRDGPVPADEVLKAAGDNGISPATLNRAKPGVAESYYSKTKGWFWQLIPGSEF
jgi:hypothetical protein